MGARTGITGGRESEKDPAGDRYGIGSGPGSLRVVATTLTCLPSALGYKERALLGRHPLLRAELGRLYNSSEATTLPVWERLSADAAARRTKPGLAAGSQQRTAAAPPPQPPAVEPGAAAPRPAPGSLRNTSGCGPGAVGPGLAHARAHAHCTHMRTHLAHACRARAGHPRMLRANSHAHLAPLFLPVSPGLSPTRKAPWSWRRSGCGARSSSPAAPDWTPSTSSRCGASSRRAAALRAGSVGPKAPSVVVARAQCGGAEGFGCRPTAACSVKCDSVCT